MTPRVVICTIGLPCIDLGTMVAKIKLLAQMSILVEKEEDV